MRMLYGLEFLFLAKELNEAKDYFIDNFYELGRGRFRLKLLRRGEQLNLLCVLPYSISRAYAFEHAEAPTNFSIAVRKRIKGFKITEVQRLNNDRIVMLVLQKADETANIIIELFGKGNLIVTDANGKITIAHVQHKFSDREISVGKQYVAPKSSAIDLLDSKSVSDAIDDAAKSSSSLSEALQKRLQIGKHYNAQILEDIGIGVATDKSAFDESKQKRFKDALEGYINGSKGFYLYKENNATVDFSVGMLKRYSNLEATRFDSLSTVLSAFYEGEPIEEKENAAVIELEKSIEKQRALITDAGAEINESRSVADFIFANMAEINGIIEHASASKHATKEELQKLSKSIKIKDVDLKNKTITIDIGGK